MAEIYEAEGGDVEAKIAGSTLEVCQRLFSNLCDSYTLRHRRLRGIEMVLASRSDVMDSNERDAYILEKGELIRMMDKIRKWKAKVKEAVMHKFNYELVETPNSTTARVEDVQRYMHAANGANMFPAVPAVERHGTQQSLVPYQVAMPQIRQSFPPVQHQHQHQQHHAAGFQGQIYAPGFNEPPPSAPLAHAPMVFPGNQLPASEPYLRSQYSAPFLRGPDPVGHMTEQDHHTRRLEQIPSENGTETPKAKPATLETANGSVKRQKKPVTIRRPDGTPITFDQPAHEQKKSVSLKDKKANPLVRHDFYRRTEDRSESAAATATATTRVNTSFPPDPWVGPEHEAGIRLAIKNISWSKYPDESDEEFNVRCQQQRGLHGKLKIIEDMAAEAARDNEFNIRPTVDENQPYGAAPVGYGYPGPIMVGPPPAPPLPQYAGGFMGYHNYPGPQYVAPAPDMHQGYQGAPVRPHRQGQHYMSAPDQAPQQPRLHHMHSRPSMPAMHQMYHAPSHASFQPDGNGMMVSPTSTGFPEDAQQQQHHQHPQHPTHHSSQQYLRPRPSQQF